MDTTNKQNTARANAHTFPRECKRFIPSLLLYYEQGVVPGNVFYHILTNNLKQTIEVGDVDVRKEIARIILWLNNHFLPEAWGSPGAVVGWKGHKGLQGLDEHVEEVL